MKSFKTLFFGIVTLLGANTFAESFYKQPREDWQWQEKESLTQTRYEVVTKSKKTLYVQKGRLIEDARLLNHKAAYCMFTRDRSDPTKGLGRAIGKVVIGPMMIGRYTVESTGKAVSKKHKKEFDVQAQDSKRMIKGIYGSKNSANTIVYSVLSKNEHNGYPAIVLIGESNGRDSTQVVCYTTSYKTMQSILTPHWKRL